MSAGRVAAVLCLISGAGCLAAARREPPGLVARRARFDERLPLIVTLASDKAEYVVGETITFTVTIGNPGPEAVTCFDGPDIMGFWNPGDFDLLDFSPAEEAMWQRGPVDPWFAEPDGTRNGLVGKLPGGPVNEDTEGAEFVTIPSGGALVRTETVPAKVAGRWRVAAELDSRQNYLVTGHEPMSGSFGFRAGDEAADAEHRRRAKEAEEAHRAGMAEQGWRWNGSRRWFEKIVPGVALGTARSNEIEIAVRPAE